MVDGNRMGRSRTEDVSDEDLVAFLDGELPEKQALDIQQRLTNDLTLQRRVSELQQSWSLLDCLPENPADSRLAETTIELVALKLQEDRRQSFGSLVKRWKWPLLAGATMMAILAGIASARLRHRQQAQALLRTLPLLTRFSDLKLIDSPQWLERLAEINSLTEAGLPLYQQSEFPAVPTSIDELDNWVDALDPVLRLKLYEDSKSFRALPDARQNTLREVDELLKRTGSHEYSLVLKAYSGLISQAIGSAELAQMEANQDLEQRASKLSQAVDRELAIAYANSLEDTEKHRIRQWANRFMEKHFDYFLELEDPDSEIVLLLDLPSADSILQPEDIRELVDCIEPKGKELLGRLDEQQRMKSLRLWVYTASPIHRHRPQYSSKELREKFHLLPVDQQNRLIYLPGSEVIKLLTDQASSSSD